MVKKTEPKAVPDDILEAKRKAAMIDFMLENGWLACTIQSGSARGNLAFNTWKALLPAGTEMPAEYAKFFNTKNRSGMPDTFFVQIHTSHAVFVEAKNAHGRLSPVQKAFKWFCDVVGIDHITAKSRDDIKPYLNELTEKQGRPKPYPYLI